MNPHSGQGPSRTPAASRCLSYAFAAEELKRPVLPLPPDAGRDYRILSGPLAAAMEIPRRLDPDFASITPNMIWPADRAWYVASEIDFDSTLVGGSAGLIDAPPLGRLVGPGAEQEDRESKQVHHRPVKEEE